MKDYVLMWKKFLKICFALILAFVLFIIIIITVFFLYIYISKKLSTYTNPKDYLIVKEKMQSQEEINHFPEKIPQNATAIHMYGWTNMPYDGETFLLEFQIDKQYIEKELAKQKFWNKNDKIGQKRKIFFMPHIYKDFDENEFTYYVIKEFGDEWTYEQAFPYFNGIGVNKEQNKILYYHISPAD